MLGMLRRDMLRMASRILASVQPHCHTLAHQIRFSLRLAPDSAAHLVFRDCIVDPAPARPLQHYLLVEPHYQVAESNNVSHFVGTFRYLNSLCCNSITCHNSAQSHQFPQNTALLCRGSTLLSQVTTGTAPISPRPAMSVEAYGAPTPDTNDFEAENTIFAFSLGQLGMLYNPKSLGARSLPS
jgi:hypothetical protein